MTDYLRCQFTTPSGIRCLLDFDAPHSHADAEALAASEPCVNAYPDYARRSFEPCGHDAADHDDGCQRCPCAEYRTDGAPD